MNADDEFEKLRKAWPNVQVRADAGQPIVYLPSFRFRSGGTDIMMDLLLYPRSHGSYTTRLFFRNQLSKGQNWRSYFVCGETWWAPSWQNVIADQPWISMLASHLQAVA